MNEKYAKIIETGRIDKLQSMNRIKYLQILMIILAVFYYEFHGFNTLTFNYMFFFFFFI